jgi:hypothetical protein
MDRGDGVETAVLSGLVGSWVEMGVGGTRRRSLEAAALVGLVLFTSLYRGDGVVIDFGEVGGRLVNMRFGGDGILLVSVDVDGAIIKCRDSVSSSLGFARNAALFRDEGALLARDNNAAMGDGSNVRVATGG